MPRNMSFMLTTEQMYNRTKTVTRRLGWGFLKPGDIIQAVEKCQGLKKGEKVKKICLIRIVDVKRENMFSFNGWYAKQEVVKEGFPNMTGVEFIKMFCKHNKCHALTPITRIEFEFL